MSISTLSVFSVSTVLDRVPLRTLPNPAPAGSFFSQPRCSVISSLSAASITDAQVVADGGLGDGSSLSTAGGQSELVALDVGSGDRCNARTVRLCDDQIAGQVAQRQRGPLGDRDLIQVRLSGAHSWIMRARPVSGRELRSFGSALGELCGFAPLTFRDAAPGDLKFRRRRLGPQSQPAIQAAALEAPVGEGQRESTSRLA
jgi:hypothetical protein